MKGYIHSIETFGAVDGPGIRYVVFMQGCPLRCIYCHNPDSWKIKDGKVTTVKKIVKDIKKYYNYIKNGGVTISGGEPLVQAKFTYKLIKKLHKLNLHVAIDTAGSLPLEKSKKVIDESDLLLLDIKALDNDLCKIVTKNTNENNLKTLDYCEKTNKPVWIRYVLLPNYTLSEEKIEALAKFLTKYKCVENVELLPYHSMGEYKWKQLGYNQPKLLVPKKEDVIKAKNILKKYNLKVR